jgi:hypothetical protein
VLLTKDDPPNVKVADFGLAKAVDSLTMLRVRPLDVSGYSYHYVRAEMLEFVL